MSLFLDSGDLVEIDRWVQCGIIAGVTTNPSLLRRHTAVADWDGLERYVRAVAGRISPRPLSVPVLSNDPLQIQAQARAFAALAGNVVVKVPIHGPDGAPNNLTLINELERVEIRVNTTAVVTAQQGLLAALAGATYVSMLVGRMSDSGLDPYSELRTLRQALDGRGSRAQIIAGSIRHPDWVLQSLVAGADVVTVPPSMLEQMLVSAGTTAFVRTFMADARLLLAGSPDPYEEDIDPATADIPLLGST